MASILPRFTHIISADDLAPLWLPARMKILAIDTSTEICSVCLSEGNNIAGEYVTRSARTHTERLMPAVQFLLDQLNWSAQDLDGVAVVNGPGSFTGLRISLSVAKGISYGLKLPVVTVSALEVAARQAPVTGFICPAMDARRGEIFTCLYERTPESLILRSEPKSVKPEIFIQELPDEPVFFCGPGAQLYWEILKNNGKSKLLFTDFILARTLATIAYERFLKGEVISGGEIRAAYLRPSDAETKGTRGTKTNRQSVAGR